MQIPTTSHPDRQRLSFLLGTQSVLTSLLAYFLLDSTLALSLQLLIAAGICAVSVWLRTGDPRSRVVAVATEVLLLAVGLQALMSTRTYLVGTALAASALVLLVRAPAGTFIAADRWAAATATSPEAARR